MNVAEPVDLDAADDREVIARVLGGDTDAFRHLIAKYEAPVFRLLGNLAPHSVGVADLAQEVFLSAFLGLASYDAGRGRFSSWLYVIAKHHAINARKKRIPVVGARFDDPVTSTTPADDYERRELKRRLDRALWALSDDHRTTYVLSEFLGLSAEEIAEVEDCTTSTVRSRLSRARTALLATIADEETTP